jgi:hypothetical protein
MLKTMHASDFKPADILAQRTWKSASAPWLAPGFSAAETETLLRFAAEAGLVHRNTDSLREEALPTAIDSSPFGKDNAMDVS